MLRIIHFKSCHIFYAGEGLIKANHQSFNDSFLVYDTDDSFTKYILTKEDVDAINAKYDNSIYQNQRVSMTDIFYDYLSKQENSTIYAFSNLQMLLKL